MHRLTRLARYAPSAGALLIALGFAAPHLALAVTGTLAPGFSIVPAASCNCAGTAAGWGCVLQVVQNLFQFVIFLGVLLCVVGCVWGGFELVLNPLNPGKRSQGKTILIDAVIGLLIVLAAYLIVNTLLTVLTTSTLSGETAFLGSTSGNYCLPTATDQTANVNNNGGTTTGVSPSSTGVNNAPSTIGNCTVSGLESSGMDSSIASTMSCITKSEDSSCSLGQPSSTDLSANGTGPSVSYGMFQINISANNLSQYPACEAAVGNAPLDCTDAFTGGAYTASNHNTTVSNTSLYANCVTATSNAQCNIQAAQDIYENHGGSKNWGTAAQNNCGS